MSELPTCCITGRIAGDPFACGDCEPCIAGVNMVPDSVKRLITERDEWAEQYEIAKTELDISHNVLGRCRTVLGNMALENEGHARLFSRWPISHEPLRHDAKNLLPVIDEALQLEQKI